MDREEEWARVSKNLEMMNTEVDREAHKYHKELFFDGTLNEDLVSEDPMIRDKMRKIRVFGNNELLFRLWYHPEPGQDLFHEAVSQVRFEHEIRCPREFLFTRFPHSNFTTEYGMLGGREALFVKALVPELDWAKQRAFTRRKKISLGLSPDMVFWFCTEATAVMLQSSAQYATNPFSPGQYLWDHLDFALQNYREHIMERRKPGELRIALRRIIDFEDREGAHLTRRYAVDLRRRLYERFGAGDFGSQLMKYWAEEKSRFEAGEPEPERG